MKRRQFIADVLGGVAALAAAPGWLRAETAVLDGTARFNKGLAANPWLVGWRTIGVEALGPTRIAMEGALPPELQGVLYRAGPAWFDRAGFRYHHWFDGDGLVQSWRFSRGAVEHRARMAATSKFVREQQAERFLVPAGGTTVPDALPIRNNDDMNTANTAVIRVGNRLFALWEGGSAFEIDPDTLASRGLVTWREDVVGAPFSAHPLIDQDGTVWNFGALSMMRGSGVLIWRIGSDGRLAQIATIADQAPGYLHSFAMTRRHLVFMLMPFREHDLGGAFFERMQLETDKPCRIAVVPKDALDQPRWFEVDYSFVYHYAGAYESRNEIVVQAVRHLDAESARSPLAAVMRGERPPESGANSDLAALRLDLASGRARWEAHGVADLEYPISDPRAPGDRPARVYAPTTVEPANSPYFNAVAAFDLDRGRRDVYRYGADVMVEEHRFIPRPGNSRTDDGWLIGTLLDVRSNRTGVAVLDAQRVAAGPIAIGWAPYSTPLGFHGWFSH
jgi:carotenoid cleavage dioxygenase